MSSWLDFLAEVPLSAVMKERVALAEQRAEAIETENDQLRQQVVALKAKVSELEKQVGARREEEQFVRHRGAFWRKEIGGAYEPVPFCPKCRVQMPPFEPAGVWICSQCDLEVQICKPPAA